VSWHMDIPLRRLHQLDTSAVDYLKELGEPGKEGFPSPPRGPVNVRAARANFVLFAPFGRAKLRKVGARGPLETVASAGRWRASASRPSNCRLPA
jgi:hypothetical protein